MTGGALVALVGLSCLTVIFDASFFPLTLMPNAVESNYRLFNQAVCFSACIAGILAALSVARCRRTSFAVVGAVGYAALAAGLGATGMVGPGCSPAWTLGAGIGCGAGLTTTMALWFGILSCFSERTGMLVLGLQALAGTALFTLVAFVAEAFANETSLALCIISGALFFSTCQSTPRLARELGTPGSLRSGTAVLGRQRTFSRVLAAPTIGFFVLVFIYAIVEAVALGNDGSPFGDLTSYAGAPLGSLVFVLVLLTSKKRDYAMTIKVIFLCLLATFWIPVFDATVFILTAGFCLSLLLMGALLIDTISNHWRLSLFLVAVGLGLMRMVYLGGLYVPGLFGVRSYSFYESTPLLMFLVYVAFAGFLMFDWYERRSYKNTETEEEADFEEDAADGRSSINPAPDTIAALACAYGLTKRETEILAIYARGRDISYACQELFLSRNTVKGYTKNLYGKLGIHSRQELIELVEKTG